MSFNITGYLKSPSCLTVHPADTPSCVFPVTTVDKNVDKQRASFTPIDDNDAAIQADYDPALYDGVPVCVQLTGKRFREEQLLAVAKKVDRLVREK